jgi:prevent-host-death family protein
MTISSHHVVMSNIEKTTVKIAEFKAHLSKFLRNVREGHPLTLMDRHTPIAQVVPYSDSLQLGKLVVRKATLRPDQVKLSAPYHKTMDVLRYAAEERQNYR